MTALSFKSDRAHECARELLTLSLSFVRHSRRNAHGVISRWLRGKVHRVIGNNVRGFEIGRIRRIRARDTARQFDEWITCMQSGRCRATAERAWSLMKNRCTLFHDGKPDCYPRGDAKMGRYGNGYKRSHDEAAPAVADGPPRDENPATMQIPRRWKFRGRLTEPGSLLARALGRRRDLVSPLYLSPSRARARFDATLGERRGYTVTHSVDRYQVRALNREK